MNHLLKQVNTNRNDLSEISKLGWSVAPNSPDLSSGDKLNTL
ncbi:hypothetical protein SAMN04487995_0348 [Dyadobacter koreensis]|uniref:Uncharacterized protein n=1 Tax=Dyadobacter koreensis TaxID=408657 RepID=A0A1H6QC08_9BACT|nr:hypothetical protein SAMN04487995_0348 [Dyadobacter koreensis]